MGLNDHVPVPDPKPKPDEDYNDYKDYPGPADPRPRLKPRSQEELNEDPAPNLRGLEGRVDTLSQRVGQIAVDYTRLIGRIDGLESWEKGQREFIQHNSERTSRLEANLRTTCEALRRLALGKSLGALGIPTEEELK